GTISLNSSGNTTWLRPNSPIVTLNGTGTISLGANANNVIQGIQQYCQLANHSKTITAAGALGNGGLTLVHQAAGVSTTSSTSALTLDTISEVMLNQGLIESTNTGDLLVVSTLIQNSGTGTLRATGAGSKVLLQSSAIDGGTLSTASGGLIETT